MSSGRTDVENGHGVGGEAEREPLLLSTSNGGAAGGASKFSYRKSSSSRKQPWIVYLSTLVAICGSYQFGSNVGYSSPTESGITEDLGLTTSEVKLVQNFVSIRVQLPNPKVEQLFDRCIVLRYSTPATTELKENMIKS
ncbi:hypothetical protein Droror1_Dr00003590 [Drosera rotundifolia]